LKFLGIKQDKEKGIRQIYTKVSLVYSSQTYLQ
jgi:hypothetical protein